MTQEEIGCFVQPANEVVVSVVIPTGFLTLSDLLAHVDYQLGTDYLAKYLDELCDQYDRGLGDAVDD